jgi:hypothetical protein
MDEAKIADLVRQYLNDRFNDRFGSIEVLDRGIRQEDHLWHVPIRLNDQTKKTYQYYGDLTELEDELRENEHLEVLLVPAA